MNEDGYIVEVTGFLSSRFAGGWIKVKDPHTGEKRPSIPIDKFRDNYRLVNSYLKHKTKLNV